MQLNVFSLITVSLALLSGVVDAQTTEQKNALERHNVGRRGKNYPVLVWDAGLTSKAQAYANTLVQKGKLEHSGVGGENLYWQSGGSNGIINAANAWMNEAPNYHGEKIPQGNFGAYGHYTQCMWKTTKRVGIAAAKDAKGGTYVVARYDPPGNIVGQSL